MKPDSVVWLVLETWWVFAISLAVFAPFIGLPVYFRSRRRLAASRVSAAANAAAVTFGSTLWLGCAGVVQVLIVRAGMSDPWLAYALVGAAVYGGYLQSKVARLGLFRSTPHELDQAKSAKASA